MSGDLDDEPDNYNGGDDIVEYNRWLATAFKKCLSGPDGKIVMAEMARFCYDKQTTFVPDDEHGRKSAFLEGRREAYHRLEALVNYDLDSNKTIDEVIHEW